MKKLLILLLILCITCFAMLSCFKNGGKGNNGDGNNSGASDGDDDGLVEDGPPDPSLVDPDGWTKPD